MSMVDGRQQTERGEAIGLGLLRRSLRGSGCAHRRLWGGGASYRRYAGGGGGRNLETGVEGALSGSLWSHQNVNVVAVVFLLGYP